jgi:hypothetical protein
MIKKTKISHVRVPLKKIHCQEGLQRKGLRKVKEGKPMAAAADQRHLNSKASDVSTLPVMNDQQVAARKLPRTHGMLTRNGSRHSQKDLNFSKKSVKWVPKPLEKKMKKEQVRTCKTFAVIIAAAFDDLGQSSHCG